ncbi:MAG: hypothetical protein ACSHX6_02710 [Akkermansiaceae bacterium]
MSGRSEQRLSTAKNVMVDSLTLFDEIMEAINESLVCLKPWLEHRIDEHLTIGGILGGLRKTLESIKERSLTGSLEDWVTSFVEKHESMGGRLC